MDLVYSVLILLNSILLGVIGFFLHRFIGHVDKSSEALVALASEVKILVVNHQNDREALRRHEAEDEKDHDKFRAEIESLGERDHELSNMIAGLWGVAKHEHEWDLPEQKPLSSRPKTRR